ncbi:tetratricopeptide repeat protein [Lignipirellula cremea]|uniref:Tetratricopeptide repeat protein n=1 Tax=Lignipirellula cremea TaxID=2528010 RepID=A0A518E559_9BACT|nr:tetratricopeptide repeat protein [Lignipirellula cremea]QDU99203.1 Tetratricopeptide repeat protein [Lignipirellula cremea]
MKTNRLGTLAVLVLSASVGCTMPGAKLPSLPQVGASRQAKSPQFEQEMSLARLAERHGQSEQATPIYNQVIEHSPDNHVAHHRLGVMAAKQGELDTAMTHLLTAEKLSEPTADLLSDIGYTAYLQHNYTLAEQKLTESIKLNPNNKAARINLGLALAFQNKTEQAFHQFRAAGSEAEAYSNLAYAQSKMGDLQHAEGNFHRALQLDNQLLPAAEGLIQVAAKTRAMNRHKGQMHRAQQAEQIVVLDQQPAAVQAPAAQPQPQPQAPVAVAQAPVAVAQAPVAVAQAPVAVAQAPVAVAQAPVAVAQAPVAVAQAAPPQVPVEVALPQAPVKQAPIQVATTEAEKLGSFATVKPVGFEQSDKGLTDKKPFDDYDSEAESGADALLLADVIVQPAPQQSLPEARPAKPAGAVEVPAQKVAFRTPVTNSAPAVNRVPEAAVLASPFSEPAINRVEPFKAYEPAMPATTFEPYGSPAVWTNNDTIEATKPSKAFIGG